jgi:hypothetical protein
MFSVRFPYHSNNSLSSYICWHGSLHINTIPVKYAKNLDRRVARFNVIYLICEFFFWHFGRVINFGLLRPDCVWIVCRKTWSCFVRYIDCMLVTGLSCPQNAVAWRGTIWNYNWNVVHSDGDRQNYKISFWWWGSSWVKGRNKMWNQ